MAFRKALTGLTASALLAFGTGVAAAQDADLTGEYAAVVTTLETLTGVAEQASPVTAAITTRYGLVYERDSGAFDSFYNDILTYTVADGVLYWETWGTWTFPDDSHVYGHSKGTTDLQTGVVTVELSEIRGGTGRFEGVTGTTSLSCVNPTNDPEGFPAMVICLAERELSL